jgi:hypothetical protein
MGTQDIFSGNPLTFFVDVTTWIVLQVLLLDVNGMDFLDFRNPVADNHFYVWLPYFEYFVFQT